MMQILIEMGYTIDAKTCGGLGVLSLRTQNISLVMKNLHKFTNHQDCPRSI
jgi:hypothetical protein